MRLTERTVAQLPTADGKAKIHWDDDPTMTGFGVLCSLSTTAKSYIAQRAIRGRTRRVTVGRVGRMSLVDARARAKTILAQMDLGIDPKVRRAPDTLREAVDQYFIDKMNLRDNTRRAYRDGIERHLADWLHRPIRSITREQVERRHREIQAEVAASGRATVRRDETIPGGATANSVMIAFRIIFNHATKDDDPPPRNPARLLGQWFPVPRRTGTVPTDRMTEFHAAAAALDNKIHADVVRLLLFTGSRLSEITGLRWEECDFGAGLIRVPAARMKGKKPHLVPMTDVVKNILVPRRAIGRDASGLVFPSVGRAVDIRDAFAAITEVCGVTVTAHDLRRTYATVAESCDLSYLAIKTLLAHTTNDITARYIQLGSERLTRAAQVVADRLKALCGIDAPAGVVPMRTA